MKCFLNKELKCCLNIWGFLVHLLGVSLDAAEDEPTRLLETVGEITVEGTT